MMETNDDGLGMTAANVMYDNELTDEQLMQFVQCVGNQQFMMSEGPHVGDRRNVLHPSVPSAQSHVDPLTHTIQQHQLPRQTNPGNVTMDSCNYSNANNPYDQYTNSARHDRYDYRSDVSSGNITPISETVTHVSETDSSIPSPHTYNSVQASVTPVNVPPNYNMTPTNTWDHNSGNYPSLPNPQIRGNIKGLDPSNINLRTTAPRHVPRQRISNSVQSVGPSVTSTPAPINQSFLTYNGAMNFNESQNVPQNTRPENTNLVEKRTVITFRVIDQIVDHSGKVLKETVLKNEEIVKSLGKVSWPETPSSISSVSRVPSSHSSGVLADVSSSDKSSGSSRLLQALETPNQSNDHNKNRSSSVPIQENLFIKVPTPVPKPSYSKSNTSSKSTVDITKSLRIESNSTPETINNKKISLLNDGNSKPQINEDEDERRETASALLSLQSQRDLTVDIGSSDDSSSGYMKVGSKIMGKWRDKNFYPAVIKQTSQNNKWSVIFEDGATRNLFENELINIECLPKGQTIMVTISEGFCAKGTISSVHVIDDKIYYDIEHLKDDKIETNRYERKDVFLTSEQAMVLSAKVRKPQISAAVYADVDLDNIVCGKRSRQYKKGHEKGHETTNLGKNPRRRQIESPVIDQSNEVISEEEEEESVPLKRKKKINNPHGNRKKCTVYVPNESMTLISPLSISPRMIKSNSVSMPPNEAVKYLGPMPENESCIFVGISFLLTSGDRVNEKDEGNAERSTPFDKSYLIRQIEAGGGRVFETFEEAKNSEEYSEIILIADTYHRSIKYIQCLAAGIPVVSHMWIIDSCRQNTILRRENYFLPSGYSIITNALPSDKMIFKKSANLFKGMRFYFGSKNPKKLEDLWSPVLFAAQAVTVDAMPIVTAGTATRKAAITVDIIIADSSCPEDVVKKGKQLKIPIVSGEYIVQCLINGRKLSYDANPKFIPEITHE